MNELGIIITVILGCSLIILPRRWAVISLLLAACYLPLDQKVEIYSFNFSSVRILALVGWVRIILRKEVSYIKINVIDKLILLWTLSGLVFFTLLYQSSAAFINRLGMAYNYIGFYFLFRALINNLNDFIFILKKFAFIIIPLAVFMVFENITGKNLFAILGSQEISEFRNGKYRSQGSFGNPILAGTMGATVLPLLVSLWWQERSKLIAILGVTAASIVLVTSGSSGPLMAALLGFMGLAVWRYRRHMKMIRWGIIFALLLLHLVMKAPVWFLFDRVSGIIGGSGWYRSFLIEQAINHFNEWWLMGTKDTAYWMPFALENAFSGEKADITNQFIGEGVNGGLLTLILFIMVIIYSFRAVGDSLKKYESSAFKEKIIVWALGAALFAHVVSFFSVAYFDQIIIFLFLLLAAIVSSNNKVMKTDIINDEISA